jgi:hypothetical protein
MRLVFLSLLLLMTAVRADEIETALQTALDAHKSGNSTAASQAMAEATRLMNAKLASGFADALPTAIGIWKAGKLETQTLEGAGGGTSLRRAYRHGDKEKGEERRANAVITVDSPVMEKVGSLLANPQIGALLGNKPLKVGSHSAVFIEKQGLIQFIVNKRFLVAVEGKKLKQSELLEIATGLKTEFLK